MLINEKPYKQWTEDDLRTLLNNDDFREGQFLDYKRTFDFLEMPDKNQKAKAKNELRNDVCSFANADGGDLIVGISEKNGLASSINPITIDNIDKFELELRNALLPIQPATPPVDFAFIHAGNGCVVVIHIEKGMLKPYITVEDQTTFRFFVRRGNRKEAMSYSEISSDFLHSASLATEIKRFRVERLSELIEDNPGMIGVIHVESCTDDIIKNIKEGLTASAITKRLLEQAGITFTEMPAEENLDFVERYSIRQAPTLLIPTSAGADIYSGAGEINGYIQMRKRQLA